MSEINSTTLVTYDAARQALQVCVTIDDVKNIKDKVEALKAYARQTNDIDMEVWLSEIRFRAESRIGEISKEIPKAKNDSALPTSGKSKSDVLKEAGLTVSTANRCEKVSDIPEEEREEIIANAKETKKPISTKKALSKIVRKEKTEKITAENEKLDTELKFNVIYADPPWRYEFSRSDSREIENQYPTMSYGELSCLDIPSSGDSVLFMWATSPKLAESLRLIEEWGFEYKTCAVWDKQKIGMGYYFRQQHELLLVAAKGNLPVPEPANRKSSVFSYPRGKHSAKPHEFYDLIDEMYPEYASEKHRIELFCRTPQDNWSVWGNQSES